MKKFHILLITLCILILSSSFSLATNDHKLVIENPVYNEANETANVFEGTNYKHPNEKVKLKDLEKVTDVENYVQYKLAEKTKKNSKAFKVDKVLEQVDGTFNYDISTINGSGVKFKGIKGNPEKVSSIAIYNIEGLDTELIEVKNMSLDYAEVTLKKNREGLVSQILHSFDGQNFSKVNYNIAQNKTHFWFNTTHFSSFTGTIDDIDITKADEVYNFDVDDYATIDSGHYVTVSGNAGTISNDGLTGSNYDQIREDNNFNQDSFDMLITGDNVFQINTYSQFPFESATYDDNLAFCIYSGSDVLQDCQTVNVVVRDYNTIQQYDYLATGVSSTQATIRGYIDYNDYTGSTPQCKMQYRVYNTGDFIDAESYSNLADGVTRSVVVTSLTPDTTYTSRIKCKHDDALAQYSVGVNFATHPEAEPVPSLLSPSDIATTSITLRSITDFGDFTGTVQGQFYYRPSTGGSWTGTGLETLTDLATYSKSVTSLTQDQEYEYYFTIEWEDGGTQSSTTVTSTFTPIDTSQQGTSTVIEDSTTKSDATSTNYGSSENIYFQSRTTTKWRTFFGFDLGAQTEVKSAYFKGYMSTLFSTVGAVDADFYYCDDIFDEDTITWANEGTEVTNCDGSPFFSIAIDQLNLSAYTNIDIKSQVNSDIDGSFTIKVITDPENYDTTSRGGSFYSKEYDTGNNAPYIDYTLADTPPTPVTLSVLEKDTTFLNLRGIVDFGSFSAVNGTFYVKTNLTGNYEPIGISYVLTNDTIFNHTISNLSSNTRYDYLIEATWDGGSSNASSLYAFTDKIESQVSQVGIDSIGDDWANLAFDLDLNDMDWVYYDFSWTEDSPRVWTSVGANNATTDGFKYYNLTGLTAGTTYVFYVSYLDEYGSKFSETIPFTPAEEDFPGIGQVTFERVYRETADMIVEVDNMGLYSAFNLKYYISHALEDNFNVTNQTTINSIGNYTYELDNLNPDQAYDVVLQIEYPDGIYNTSKYYFETLGVNDTIPPELYNYEASATTGQFTLSIEVILNELPYGDLRFNILGSLNSSYPNGLLTNYDRVNESGNYSYTFYGIDQVNLTARAELRYYNGTLPIPEGPIQPEFYDFIYTDYIDFDVEEGPIEKKCFEMLPAFDVCVEQPYLFVLLLLNGFIILGLGITVANGLLHSSMTEDNTMLNNVVLYITLATSIFILIWLKLQSLIPTWQITITFVGLVVMVFYNIMEGRR